MRVNGGVDVFPRHAGIGDDVGEGIHADEDGVIQLRASGEQMRVNRVLLAKD